MKNLSVNIFVSIVVACFLLPLLASNKATTPTFSLKADKVEVSDEAKRKAEYVFIEAENQKLAGKYDAYFELLKHAHSIDPTNSSISFYYGYSLLLFQQLDEKIAEQSLDLMKEHYLESPEDYFESFFYGTVAQKINGQEPIVDIWENLVKIFRNKPQVWSRLAEAYTSKQNWDKAIAVYDSLEKWQQGASADLALKRAQIYVAKKDTAAAISEMKQLLATAPRNVGYLVEVSNIFTNYTMLDSALCYLDSAQSIEPENGYILLEKAQLYNTLRDSANYDKCVYQGLVSEDMSIDEKFNVLLAYSRDLLQKNDSSERVNNLFNKMLEIHPRETNLRSLYSQYLATKKDYAQAAEQMSYALDIDPTNAENWKNEVLLYMLGENYPKAIEAADKAITYNPDDIDLYQYIGPAYYQIKEYDKAIEIYHKTLTLIDSTDFETQSNVYGGIADALFSKGDTIDAFASYDKALELYPGNTGVMNNYAYFLSLSGKDLDKAETLSSKAVKAEPNNSTYIDTYAWIFFKKREYNLALLYIESAIAKMENESADVFEHYGDILFMSGRPEDAIVQWEKALQLDPDNELVKRKVTHKTYFYK